MENKAQSISNFDTINFYLAHNPNNVNSVVESTTAITISKDFNTVYGYTANLKKIMAKGHFLNLTKI